MDTTPGTTGLSKSAQADGPDTLQRRSEFIRGVVAALPIAPAIAVYGLVFGAQAFQKGLSFREVALMTGSNYAGGSEFAAINLWASPPPVLVITALTLVINSRHIIMGAALTPFIQHFPRWKALIILFFMSDESWAISYNDTVRKARLGQPVPFSLAFYAGDAAMIYLNWLVSTTAGALIGPLLGDINRYGFDMAFPAVFLFILASMWTGWRAARPWGVSLVVAAGMHLLVPGAWYIMGGTLAGLATAFLLAKPQ